MELSPRFPSLQKKEKKKTLIYSIQEVLLKKDEIYFKKHAKTEKNIYYLFFLNFFFSLVICVLWEACLTVQLKVTDYYILIEI